MNGAHPTIKVCFDGNAECRTLERQLLKANSRDTLNTILGTTHGDDAALLKYMDCNKTDCALKMFETEHAWETPVYIANAIAK